ncbi:hypothetical protein CC78DRAFT_9965 [Lojkania enalia]|uniref:Ig-like domain-containing protein n=1 Tax=Lojkania enalia TaxID=147567 RepID=A0A9P4TRW0_9PLEO|nr:hypothetical protein CC78DRAFT_9965 [Didymosphaeria enalia]
MEPTTTRILLFSILLSISTASTIPSQQCYCLFFPPYKPTPCTTLSPDYLSLLGARQPAASRNIPLQFASRSTILQILNPDTSSSAKNAPVLRTTDGTPILLPKGGETLVLCEAEADDYEPQARWKLRDEPDAGGPDVYVAQVIVGVVVLVILWEVWGGIWPRRKWTEGCRPLGRYGDE